jgi:hypothetical protein
LNNKNTLNIPTPWYLQSSPVGPRPPIHCRAHMQGVSMTWDQTSNIDGLPPTDRQNTSTRSLRGTCKTSQINTRMTGMSCCYLLSFCTITMCTHQCNSLLSWSILVETLTWASSLSSHGQHWKWSTTSWITWHRD